MDYTNVIIKPLITEKSTHQAATKNEYAFKVHSSANKPEIKHAVEALYNVKVIDVHTMTRKGKPRRTKTGETKSPDFKRAIVRLDANSKIDLF